jgi:hypothetical protein
VQVSLFATHSITIHHRLSHPSPSTSNAGGLTYVSGQQGQSLYRMQDIRGVQAGLYRSAVPQEWMGKQFKAFLQHKTDTT